MHVPCYRLEKLHALLRDKGFHDRMDLSPSYPAMLNTATSKPERAAA